MQPRLSFYVLPGGPTSAIAAEAAGASPSGYNGPMIDPHCQGLTSPVSSNVSVKWNEESIRRTLHPPDKDYGLMKVSEPKTPFIYDEAKTKSPVRAEVLAQRRWMLPEPSVRMMQTCRKLGENANWNSRRRGRCTTYEFFAIKEARETVKKGQSEEQAEGEVAQEEAEMLAKAQEEEATEKAAEARAKAGAAAIARAVAAAAAKAASNVA
nr:protein phosphatase inhibitor 2-like [Rhipicephalus microplus]